MTDKLNDKDLKNVNGGKMMTPDIGPTDYPVYSFQKDEVIYGDRLHRSYYKVLEDVSSVLGTYGVPCDLYISSESQVYNETVKACALDSLRKDYNN